MTKLSGAIRKITIKHTNITMDIHIYILNKSLELSFHLPHQRGLLQVHDRAHQLATLVRQQYMVDLQ